MSIKGFEVGGVQQQYDYTALDNIPANLVQDANYVHTDNNYTNADKTKLSGIEAQANKTTIDATLTHSGQAADAKATGDAISALNAQVIASMPHDTASGSIASFPDGAAMPVRDLSVDIEPVQAGSGDPSPDNIRPISGWTEATVTRTAKNIFNPAVFTDNGGVLQEDGSYYVANQSNIYKKHIWDNNGYSGQIAITWWHKDNATASSIGSYPRIFYTDGTSSNPSPLTASPNAWAVATLVSNASKIVDYVDFGYSSNKSGYYYGQIELGSTLTEYEPFNAQVYTIDLDGTRYGGTLDVLTGKMYARPYYPSYNGETLVGPWVSSMDKYEEGATPTIGAQVVDMGGTVTEITLTPTEITTLLGTNNIFADCGDTTVNYYADTTLFVNKKIAAAVAALS